MNADSNPPEIRLATTQDFDAVVLMVAEFHDVAHLPFSMALTGRALRELLENPNLGFVLIAAQASGMIGYTLVSFGFSLEFGGRDGFVDELFVRPAFQKQGVGTALLLQAEQHAAGYGIHALHLESEFDNPGATALYERKSYQKHARFLMTKWLKPQGAIDQSTPMSRI